MTQKSDHFWSAESRGRSRRAPEVELPDEIEALRDYLRASSDWLWQVDKNFNYTYVSQGIVRVLGLPVDSLLGGYVFFSGPL